MYKCFFSYLYKIVTTYLISQIYLLGKKVSYQPCTIYVWQVVLNSCYAPLCDDDGDDDDVCD